MPISRSCARLLACASVILFSSCGGGQPVSTPPPPPPPIGLSLSVSSLQVLQDGTPSSVTATVTRPAGNTNSVTLTTSTLPSGLSTQIIPPGSGTSGQVVFTSQSAAAGTDSITITASDGTTSANANLSLTVAIVATIGNKINTSVGETGKLGAFMSTSFQPASWSDQFFINHPDTSALDNLGSEHIRIQALERDVPMTGPSTWNFTYLDGVVNPILSVTDHSPEFQIAVAPAWMNDASGHLDTTNHLQDFANYCANLVRYYNTLAGFTDDSGVTHVHSPYTPITWWGIFNEPNINGLTPAQYAQLYDTVVRAMQAVDPTIKFSAVELADFGTEPEKYMPTFVSSVTAHVDVVSTHFYSTCNQKTSDEAIFATIPTFTTDVSYIYSQLATNPALASVPVWVTENNVNADYAAAGGMSNCNPGTIFVPDARGTSAYFAAWRPYVFSQLSQTGSEALYHWDYNADVQYGEVDGSTGQIYRSYWVDYWLGQYFAPGTAPVILDLNVTESSTVETLAVQRADGSVVVMVANRAVHASSDDNGAGDPRTVVLDLSAWPAFSSASLLAINAQTDPASGPSPQTITPAPRMTVTLGGYGVSFLKLNP